MEKGQGVYPLPVHTEPPFWLFVHIFFVGGDAGREMSVVQDSKTYFSKSA